MQLTKASAPWHLWWIGTLAVLWNAIGCLDYLASQFQVESYLAQFTPEQREFFRGFPAWVVASWALAVWGSLAGSLGLLLRRSWALYAFLLAAAGMAITSVHNFLIMDGAGIMGPGGVAFSALIWVVAVVLIVYCARMKRRNILR